MHIPTRLQNSLLASIHNDFGQEMELFLAEIFMQFAPQHSWDRQTIPTPSGAQMRPPIRLNHHQQILETQPAGNNHQANPSMLQNSPTYDAQRSHGQQDPVGNPHYASQHSPTVRNTNPPTGEALQPAPLLHSDSPGNSRTTFPRCPTGHICPHTDCTFPHGPPFFSKIASLSTSAPPIFATSGVLHLQRLIKQASPQTFSLVKELR